MSKYQTPVCECGEHLVYVEEVLVRLERKINKDGTLSQRQSTRLDDATELDELLRCPKCTNRYALIESDEGKVTRGENLDETYGHADQDDPYFAKKDADSR